MSAADVVIQDLYETDNDKYFSMYSAFNDGFMYSYPYYTVEKLNLTDCKSKNVFSLPELDEFFEETEDNYLLKSLGA